MTSDSAKKCQSDNDKMLDDKIISDNNASSEYWSGHNTFVSENPDELVDRLHLTFPEKESGNDTNLFDDEIFAIFAKLSEYKCNNPAPHKMQQLKSFDRL